MHTLRIVLSCIYRGLHTIVKKKDLIGFTKVHDTHARKYGYVVLLLALLSWLPVSAECCQTVFHQLVMEGGLVRLVSLQCCFTSTETTSRIRDGEPRTATSTVTQPPGRFTSTDTVGLLGAGSPGRPPRLSHSS